MKTSFEESVVAELEHTVVAAMENPDDKKTEILRTMRISPDYSIDLALTTYTPHAMPYGVSGYAHQLFVCHDTALPQPIVGTSELAGKVCERPVIFSSLFTHDDDGRRLHGRSGTLPAGLLDDAPKEDFDFIAHTQHIAEAFSRDDLYEIEDTHARWDEQLVAKFLYHTSKLVADGAYIETSYKMFEPDEDTHVFASYITRTGDMRHLDQFSLEYPYLRFSVCEGDIETVYERSVTGRLDVKTRLADESVRYADLPSFEAHHDDEGNLVAYTYDQHEIEAMEAENRAHGLYQPTKENIVQLMKYAVLLK